MEKTLATKGVIILNEANKTAEIRIYSQIGGWGCDGQELADDLNRLVEWGYKHISVRINSTGGSVVEGISILSAILNINQKGDIVNTFIDGIAASMAGVIAVCGYAPNMNDFATLMVHDPYIPGYDSDALDENTKKQLEVVRNMMLKILSGRTNKTEEEMSQMMAQETWLNAEEALAAGFVDTIVSTSKKRPAPANAGAQSKIRMAELLAFYDAQLVSQQPASNEPPTQGQQEPPAEPPIESTAQNEPPTQAKQEPPITISSNMKKIALALGLPEDADEATILKAIEKNKSNTVLNESLTDQVAVLNARLQEQDAQLQQLKDREAEDIVDNAIKEGRLWKNDRDKWVSLAKSQPETVKATIARMSTHPNLASKASEQDEYDTMSFQEMSNKGIVEWVKVHKPAAYARAKEERYGKTSKNK